MNTTETLIRPAIRFDFDALVPSFSRAVASLDHAAKVEAERAGIPAGLTELLRLRTSQINGCAYCVDTHSRDARDAGESFQRISAVAVWEESNFFTQKERSAFALADSVARLADTHVPDAIVADVLEVWTEAEAAAILAILVSINAWNEIGVTARCWRASVENV
ncbi:carboxymuconolactone decarboxylase family protein [Microbacterium sp. ASV49]|uniref:Carboxymuconolactone decarboxylase family protein n=1 Tax=Microbacterium candidum TaxID=3041922 RepID=A0ABT7N2L9_9MICO|nr:carboxymuconolactone decarboxylase family protein [Microbacterium sp. ASV49]MDL9980949.1 carboxymuconolactone decarboxylase family protein [Microbacterium sp. ASV49]